MVVHILCAAAAAAVPAPILPGLPWPQALQGHDDENWPMSLVDNSGRATDALVARYTVLRTLSPGEMLPPTASAKAHISMSVATHKSTYRTLDHVHDTHLWSHAW